MLGVQPWSVSLWADELYEQLLWRSAIRTSESPFGRRAFPGVLLPSFLLKLQLVTSSFTHA